MLQKLWEIKLNWDESVPIDIATSWNKYKEQIELLSNCTFPRRIIGNSAVKIQLAFVMLAKTHIEL